MLQVNAEPWFKDKKVLLIGGTVALLLVAVIAGYFIGQAMNQKEDLKKTIATLTSEIGKMLVLPDEEPQVAQIADPELLKDEPFYTNVQKDDYLLVYSKAQLAILYRQKEHKLINVDHVEVGTDDTSATKK